jgi:hypothetical protein
LEKGDNSVPTKRTLKFDPSESVNFDSKGFGFKDFDPESKTSEELVLEAGFAGDLEAGFWGVAAWEAGAPEARAFAPGFRLRSCCAAMPYIPRKSTE